MRVCETEWGWGGKVASHQRPFKLSGRHAADSTARRW